MGVLASRLDPSSDAYAANRAANLELLARERVELLLDRDGPFLELSPLAAWGTDFHVGASGVTGIGVVCGVECVITARLGSDQLTVQGLSFDQPRNVFAITGGTGRWRNAGGQVVVRDVSETESDITLFISDLG